MPPHSKPFIAMQCTAVYFAKVYFAQLLLFLDYCSISTSTSHIAVVSMMGLPLGANGILTIPYINLASQNLIKRDAAWFAWEKNTNIVWSYVGGDLKREGIAKHPCNVGFTIAITSVFGFRLKINSLLPLFIIMLTSLIPHSH